MNNVEYQDAYSKGFKDGYAEARRWHSVEEKPKEDKEYLVKVNILGDEYKKVLKFTNCIKKLKPFNMYELTQDFGFYYFDYERGYGVHIPEQILGWMEIPE